jgi:hypothetical protein
MSTQGLPALLLWACRKGYEFEFMAAPVLAAAKALGLNLTLQLHITGVWGVGMYDKRKRHSQDSSDVGGGQGCLWVGWAQ